MGNPTGISQNCSLSSCQQCRKAPTLETAIKLLADEVYLTAQAYIAGETEAEICKAKIEHDQKALKSLGYELRLLGRDGKVSVIVTKTGALPFSNDLRFCRCGESGQLVFCDRLWCERCLRTFLVERNYYD